MRMLTSLALRYLSQNFADDSPEVYVIQAAVIRSIIYFQDSTRNMTPEYAATVSGYLQCNFN